MTKLRVVKGDYDRYGATVQQVMYALNEFGECRLQNVEDTADLRKAIRREARKLQIKIMTRAYNKLVLVVAMEPTLKARVFGEATMRRANNIRTDADAAAVRAANMPPGREIDCSGI